MNLRLHAGLVFCILLLCAAALAQSPRSVPDTVGRLRTIGFQGDSEREREKARQQIGISVQQQEQLTRLYAEADKKEKAAGKELHDLYRQQRTLYSAYVIDRVQGRDLRKKIEQMHSQLLQIHADTEDGLRKLLNRDQFERLNAALQEHRRENHREPDRRTGEEKSSNRSGSDQDREKKAPHLNDVGSSPAEKISLSAQSKEDAPDFRIGPARRRVGQSTSHTRYML